MGYDVLLAVDGEDAVKMYQQHHDIISLVLLDMVMPKMNGRDTFLALREVDPTVKVILSSGFSYDANTSGLIEQGALGFIQKPYHRSKLSQMIFNNIKS